MGNRYNEIKNYIESYGYKLLSDEYKDNKKNLKLQCPKGHVFKKSFNAFQKGQRCPVCSNIRKKKNMTHSYEYVKSYIESYDGYKLLSVEYNGNTDKLKIQCPEGHVFEKSFNAFQKGQRCTTCYNLSRGKTRLYSYEYVKSYIESFGYKLLSDEYKKSSEKLKIQCPEGHIYRAKFNSFQQGCRCPVCGNVNKKNQPHKNTYQNVKSYIEYFEGYELVSDKYENTNSNLLIKCPEGHIFEKSFKRFKAGERCYKCLFSKLEKEVYDFIVNIYSGEIKPNNRIIISPKELDIYLPNNNIAIEFNGLYWHSQSHLNDKNYHLNKTKECENKNIQLLHIFENEWLEKKDIWKSIISSKLNKNKRIGARKCHIKEIDTKIKNDFLQENHIQGKDFSSIKLGLYFQNNLISVMTFGKSRFNKKYEWEMLRFCNKKYYNVIGAASKLMKYFTSNYNPKSIVSYANIRYSNGNLYKKLGFVYLHRSDPNYFYFKRKTVLSRIQCQKHKLKNILGDCFDENKTEKQNMIDSGWEVVYDCGNYVYEWKYGEIKNVDK